jgi:hypothetical protein
MSNKLFIDRRVAVTGAKSKILMDNPVAMHTFVIQLLESLPVYVDDAAAGVGGLTAGQLYKNSTTNTISYKA